MDSTKPNSGTKPDLGDTKPNLGGRPRASFNRDLVFEARRVGCSWSDIAERITRSGTPISDETLRRGMADYVPPAKPVRPDPRSLDWNIAQYAVTPAASAPATVSEPTPVPEANPAPEPPRRPLTVSELKDLRWEQEARGTAWIRQHHPAEVVEEFLRSKFNCYPARERDPMLEKIIAAEAAGDRVEANRLMAESIRSEVAKPRELRLLPHGCQCVCDDCVFARESGWTQKDGVWTLTSASRVPQAAPEPAETPPPMPEKPPLELSKAEREAAVERGWLWSHEFQKWFRVEKP